MAPEECVRPMGPGTQQHCKTVKHQILNFYMQRHHAEASYHTFARQRLVISVEVCLDFAVDITYNNVALPYERVISNGYIQLYG